MSDSAELLRRFMLALCVWREARGESDWGKLLVAKTAVNRARDIYGRWPTTIPGVITQKYQFSAFNLGDPNALLFPPEGSDIWRACVDAADKALSATPDEYTTANHYCVSTLRPKWYDASKIVANEGHHTFFHL